MYGTCEFSLKAWTHTILTSITFKKVNEVLNGVLRCKTRDDEAEDVQHGNPIGEDHWKKILAYFADFLNSDYPVLLRRWAIWSQPTTDLLWVNRDPGLNRKPLALKDISIQFHCICLSFSRRYVWLTFSLLFCLRGREVHCHLEKMDRYFQRMETGRWLSPVQGPSLQN